MVATSFDMVFHDARLRGRDGRCDIGVSGGRISALGASLPDGAVTHDLGGRLVLPGFVDSHIHLDKSCLLGRCNHGAGGLPGAIAEVAALKRRFTVEDVYARGARTIEKAILQGTMRMRTHVEIDPRIGLRSFEAVRRLKADYAFALDLSICVFPQEGMTNDPGTEALLLRAIAEGADLLGGCPYTDTDPHAQIARLFSIAVEHDLDLDFHLDFDLDAGWTHLWEVCRQTEANGWGGRVAAGHVTKLSAMDDATFAVHAKRLAEAGVAVTALPATDLYLMGRDRSFDVPRGVAPVHRLAELGVAASIATNNVLNPFTPFGDCSLLRMASLYANVAQIGPEGFDACIDLVTDGPARLMRLTDYGIAVGNPADLVVLDAADAQSAIAEIAAPLMGFKDGRPTFVRPAARLLRPDDSASALPSLCPLDTNSDWPDPKWYAPPVQLAG